MGEMIDEEVEFENLERRILKINKESAREEFTAKLAKIRKEILELRNGLDLQDKLQVAGNASDHLESQKELPDDLQERKSKDVKTIKNELGCPNQTESMRRIGTCGLEDKSCVTGVFASGHSMSADMIRRYSRQLLVPAFGVSGQEKLSMSSVLVVGMGGLGSPVALYLAASGVGKLGLVDNDVVELSNLHRQIIHTEDFIGQSKVSSAASACLRLNSSIQLEEYGNGLNAANAVEIISQYDLVVDATDNLPTRYIISDACVATGKPLVSGAALGLEGQLTVYNHKNGPCYRCLFPTPPPLSARQRCSDNGVLGVVPGIIGTFQALEAIKIASGVGETLNSRMLLLDALSARIHMVRLRGRNSECIACGNTPQILASNLSDYDYEQFTQSTLSEEEPKPQKLISEEDRISAEELQKHLDSGKPCVLLDVREPHEFAISSLPNSLNIPLSTLKEKLPILRSALDSSIASSEKLVNGDAPVQLELLVNSGNGDSALTVAIPPVFVICRRGNDSQKAVQLLRNEGFSTLVDVVGGLESWAKNVDREFPCY
ncbi:hypothetical protein R1sor_021310 [Riccia sorocarpa]|uniref:Adenylyltransferase and sulfurtransferase MOCS3 n=1 Tax=Riccia sorocarpa TaxID=122646 RepID=A0ABD3GKY7_9MARC